MCLVRLAAPGRELSVPAARAAPVRSTSAGASLRVGNARKWRMHHSLKMASIPCGERYARSRPNLRQTGRGQKECGGVPMRRSWANCLT